MWRTWQPQSWTLLAECASTLMHHFTPGNENSPPLPSPHLCGHHRLSKHVGNSVWYAGSSERKTAVGNTPRLSWCLCSSGTVAVSVVRKGQSPQNLHLHLRHLSKSSYAEWLPLTEQFGEIVPVMLVKLDRLWMSLDLHCTHFTLLIGKVISKFRARDKKSVTGKVFLSVSVVHCWSTTESLLCLVCLTTETCNITNLQRNR